MRIALIDPSLFTLPYDAALAGGLQEHGHEVVLYGRKPGAHDSSAPGVTLVPGFYRFAEHRAVRALPERVRLGVKGADHLASMLWLRRSLGKLRPDIIHFQWLPLPVIDRRFLAGLRRIAPLVPHGARHQPVQRRSQFRPAGVRHGPRLRRLQPADRAHGARARKAASAWRRPGPRRHHPARAARQIGTRPSRRSHGRRHHLPHVRKDQAVQGNSAADRGVLPSSRCAARPGAAARRGQALHGSRGPAHARGGTRRRFRPRAPLRPRRGAAGTLRPGHDRRVPVPGKSKRAAC